MVLCEGCGVTPLTMRYKDIGLGFCQKCGSKSCKLRVRPIPPEGKSCLQCSTSISGRAKSGLCKKCMQTAIHGSGRYKEDARVRASIYSRTLEARLKNAPYYAKRRGKVWALTWEQHLELLTADKCHYCFGPLPETGLGIDRKDNSLGYIPGNCVPCCKPCNTFKSVNRTESEVLAIKRPKTQEAKA